MCRYEDSLLCRLRNYAEKSFKEFVLVWSCHSTASPVVDHLILLMLFSRIPGFMFIAYIVLITILGPCMFVVTNYTKSVYLCQ